MARLSWISIAFFVILAFAINTLAQWDIDQSPAPAVQIVPQGGEGSLKAEECAGACDFRCSATSHKKPCLFFCNMCCQKCLCVPSGTYGHKEECPCYNNWKTQEGGPKCP
ncbi:gibberellin-regulated protein 12 [Rosa chinensis]|uniref:gibberellin-regulated protein 12 n=1 Tax=Rosa chinensis TaxID=74649 RepID=UPI000D094928|nr:gibberellin-regulated protein 12 [Rosa chinensis]